ncbi:uncharacterized protein METZ01_LOCUS152155 [marine metagenome]|uniref:Uncharacterized protein n=1 Tax=marine metagenome TaxID=408172 RepID=A0A382ADG6_9ZZZZ
MAIEATLEYFNHRYPWPEETMSFSLKDDADPILVRRFSIS